MPEACELVEDGHINEEQFRDFVFDNPVRLWSGMTPDFSSPIPDARNDVVDQLLLDRS